MYSAVLKNVSCTVQYRNHTGIPITRLVIILKVQLWWCTILWKVLPRHVQSIYSAVQILQSTVQQPFRNQFLPLASKQNNKAQYSTVL
jgi:hypothetical protein